MELWKLTFRILVLPLAYAAAMTLVMLDPWHWGRDVLVFLIGGLIAVAAVYIQTRVTSLEVQAHEAQGDIETLRDKLLDRRSREFRDMGQ